MRIEPLKNKWTEDYFDAFKKDIKSAVEHFKQQFKTGVEYNFDDINKAIIESFPDLYPSDVLSVCACGDNYLDGYSDERCDECFCSKECADSRQNGDL